MLNGIQSKTIYNQSDAIVCGGGDGGGDCVVFFSILQSIRYFVSYKLESGVFMSA